jgi:quinol monooxygenase YgiN
MIIVEGWVRLQPGEIERLRPAAIEMMRATKALEPGCLEYAFAVDLADSDILRIVERWVDQAALDAHFASPHMATFNQAMAGAKLAGMSVKAYAGEQVRVLMEG